MKNALKIIGLLLVGFIVLVNRSVNCILEAVDSMARGDRKDKGLF